MSADAILKITEDLENNVIVVWDHDNRSTPDKDIDTRSTKHPEDNLWVYVLETNKVCPQKTQQMQIEVHDSLSVYDGFPLILYMDW